MKKLLISLLLSISCIAHAEVINLECMGYLTMIADPVKHPGPVGNSSSLNPGVPYSKQNDPARFAFRPGQLNQTTYAPINFTVDTTESSIYISSSYFTTPYTYHPVNIGTGSFSATGYTQDNISNQYIIININRVTTKFDFVINMVYQNPTTVYARQIKGDGKCERSIEAKPKF